MSDHSDVRSALAANSVSVPLTQEGLKNFLKDLIVEGAFSEGTIRQILFDAVNSARIVRRRGLQKGKGKGNPRPKPNKKKKGKKGTSDSTTIEVKTLDALIQFLIDEDVDLSVDGLINLGYTQGDGELKIPDEGLNGITVEKLQGDSVLAALFEDIVRKHVFEKTSDRGGNLLSRGKAVFGNADGDLPKGFGKVFPRIKSVKPADRKKAKEVFNVASERLTYPREDSDESEDEVSDPELPEPKPTK